VMLTSVTSLEGSWIPEPLDWSTSGAKVSVAVEVNGLVVDEGSSWCEVDDVGVGLVEEVVVVVLDVARVGDLIAATCDDTGAEDDEDAEEAAVVAVVVVSSVSRCVVAWDDVAVSFVCESVSSS